MLTMMTPQHMDHVSIARDGVRFVINGLPLCAAPNPPHSGRCDGVVVIAAHAGREVRFHPGDVIKSVDGMKVTRAGQFISLVQKALQSGQKTIRLGRVRDGTYQVVQLQAADAPVLQALQTIPIPPRPPSVAPHHHSRHARVGGSTRPGERMRPARTVSPVRGSRVSAARRPG